MWLRAFQIIKCSILAAVCICVLPLSAQEESKDSVKRVQLKEVVVEAQQQKTSATVSTYFPTQKQKNASQTGIDLLNRMDIPQLALGNGTSVKTISDKPVNVFIDWLPATADDLKNMRTADVKRVEYYDYPSDPRFLGNAHVVNFIMKRYEYGGYLKTSASERFIANDGQLNLFGKIQVKKFTFDLGLGGSYSKSSHDYSESEETYRLPQEDGTLKTFKRVESVTHANKRSYVLWPTLKVVYNTEKITISNLVGASFDHTPTRDMGGNISFIPDLAGPTVYSSIGSKYQNSMSYSGNWNFMLGNGNTINFNPNYSYTHSRQSNHYKEGTAEFPNDASDDSHQGHARLQFSHSFSNHESLSLFCMGLLYRSSTNYTGTAEMNDRLSTYRIGPGLTYSFSKNKYYIYLAAGFNYDYSKYGLTIKHSTQPWADASAQYSFDDKNKISASFHHMTSVPLSSYRSEAVIQSNPLLSYTGNPALKPYKSYDYSVTYTCMPNNQFRFSVYANAWTVGNRYAFVYTPTSTGILRTIEQPVGGFTALDAGAYGRVSLFHNSLQISGRISVPYCHNGYPFSTDHVNVNYTLQAYWYFGAWNMGAKYISDSYSSNYNAVNGIWTKSLKFYYVSMGWGNSSWNVSAQVTNPFTWSWRDSQNKMTSKYFDRNQTVYGAGSHCYIKLGVTYTFGFGKKINRSDEVSRQSGANSAILK